MFKLFPKRWNEAEKWCYKKCGEYETRANSTEKTVVPWMLLNYGKM